MMHMPNDPNAPITSAERAQRSVFGEIIIFNQLLMQEHFNVFQNFLKRGILMQFEFSRSS